MSGENTVIHVQTTDEMYAAVEKYCDIDTALALPDAEIFSRAVRIYTFTTHLAFLQADNIPFDVPKALTSFVHLVYECQGSEEYDQILPLIYMDRESIADVMQTQTCSNNLRAIHGVTSNMILVAAGLLESYGSKLLIHLADKAGRTEENPYARMDAYIQDALSKSPHPEQFHYDFTIGADETVDQPKKAPDNVVPLRP